VARRAISMRPAVFRVSDITTEPSRKGGFNFLGAMLAVTQATSLVAKLSTTDDTC
jgi:hypothetical protein